MFRISGKSSKRAKLDDDESNHRKVEFRESQASRPELAAAHGINDSGPSTKTLAFCPLCQFPFRYLVGQNESWHVTECMERQRITKCLGECPLGFGCKSASESHYRKYLHNLKALERSSGTSHERSNQTEEGNIQDHASEFKDSVSDHELPTMESNSEKKKPTGKHMETDIANQSLELHITDDLSQECYSEIVADIVDSLENEPANNSLTTEINRDSCLDAKSCSNRDNILFADVSESKKCHVAATSSVLSKNKGRINVVHDTTIGWNPDSADEIEKLKNDMSIDNYMQLKKEISLNKTKCTNSRNFNQVSLSSYFGLKESSKTELEVKNEKSEGSEPSVKKGNESRISQSLKASEQKSKNPQKRQCPFYKKIPGTSITVDAFSYGSIPGCTKYFLSHFHYDHYGGLKKSFKHDIYCSKITAALVRSRIKVSSKFIKELPINEEIDIDNRVKVTLLDANHCPGSVMFLFRFNDGRNILHTGDFRAVHQMADYPFLKNIDLDILYLDTTYCDPSYDFPTQQETIDFAVRVAQETVSVKPKTLIVCGTYSVGKERVFHAIANALDSKICVKAEKRRLLDCLFWKDLNDRLVSDWNLAQVHVLPMNSITIKALKEHLDRHRNFKEVLAFKPTGWTYSSKTDMKSIKPTKSGQITIYGIPYSEHSSFSELEWFVRYFKPKKIMPTVNNGSQHKRDEMTEIFRSWLQANR